MLIQDGLILDSGADTAVRKDIRISEEGRITEIGGGLSPLAGEECLCAAGRLVLPGMVNAHYHSYSNILKGTSYGEPLEIWANDTVALGGALDLDLMRLSAQLGIVEMLRAGVTACLDHIPHIRAVDTIAREYERSGFRASIAPMIADISDDHILADFGTPITERDGNKGNHLSLESMSDLYRGWCQRWHRPDGTLQMLCGINSPQRASDAALDLAKRIAEEHSLGVHAHLLETRWQADSIHSASDDPVERMARHGLLSHRTSLAHSVWLTPAQLQRIADAGSAVVLNPTSNLFLGSGIADHIGMIKRGIPAALGTDGSNCASGQNLILCARAALLLSRAGTVRYEDWLTPQTVWQMATTSGAMACGWENLGTLQEGMRADIVLIDADAPEYWPMPRPLLQILLYAGKMEVVDVLIQGKFVMRNRRLLNLDENALRSEVCRRFGELRHKFESAIRDNKDVKRAYIRAYMRHYHIEGGEV